ncbi:MAG: porin family protein [Gammaproteobacteria bacterium]|nr:porin family protein [Gammaproteobacteria bacterium]MDH3467332.1 porin family protein [Gammaproteobacteria bacterium]
MKLKFFIAGAALTTLSASPVLADDDSGWYLGGSVNRLSADQNNVNDVDFDDSDNAFGIKLGHMFTDLVGIEGGYLDLGDYHTRGNDKGIDLSLDAEGFYVVGVLNLPVANTWDIYGKLGVFAFDSDTDALDFDESSTEAFGTIGAEYDFGLWNVFGELSKIDTDTNDLSIDILSLGVKFEFGR